MCSKPKKREVSGARRAVDERKAQFVEEKKGVGKSDGFLENPSRGNPGKRKSRNLANTHIGGNSALLPRAHGTIRKSIKTKRGKFLAQAHRNEERPHQGYTAAQVYAAPRQRVYMDRPSKQNQFRMWEKASVKVKIVIKVK